MALSFSNTFPGSNTRPGARAPRLEILANGRPLLGAQEAEIITCDHYAADRFHARLALDADPASTAFWASAGEVQLDIRIALGPSPMGFNTGQSLIIGVVDRVSIDPIQRSIRLEGRDLSARLIESRTQESFSNRTASEIVALLAARHGLTPKITPTTTTIGRYYQDQHNRLTLDQFNRALSEWDLLVRLAGQEDYAVFVRGHELYFQPAAKTPRLHPITPQDALEMRLERALSLTRDIEVTVKSWNTRQQNALTQTARSKTGNSAGKTQKLVLVRPNLAPAQALQLAQSHAAALTRHRMVLSIAMPGELAMAPGDALAVSGTHSSFDQLYLIDTIHRRFSVRHGFTQYLRARNDAIAPLASTPLASQAAL